MLTPPWSWSDGERRVGNHSWSGGHKLHVDELRAKRDEYKEAMVAHEAIARFIEAEQVKQAIPDPDEGARRLWEAIMEERDLTWDDLVDASKVGAEVNRDFARAYIDSMRSMDRAGVTLLDEQQNG